MWKKNDVLINKVSISSTITLEKPYLFKPNMIELPIVVRVSPLDFLNTVVGKINNEVDEINIISYPILKISHFYFIWLNRNQCFVEN